MHWVSHFIIWIQVHNYYMWFCLTGPLLWNYSRLGCTHIHTSTVQAVAVLTFQYWGCNAPKPLWSSWPSIPIRFPIKVYNFQTWKFYHATSVECKQISPILKRFDRHNEVTSFMVTIFRLHCAKLGVQSQKLGMQLHPAPRRGWEVALKRLTAW